MVAVSRWDRAQAALPYALVLLPALFSLVREWRVEVLALALFAAAWHWLVVASGRIARPVVLVVYFAVLLAVVGVLVRFDSVFTVTGIGAFIQCFVLLPGWWAYGGVAVTVGVLISSRPRPPVEMISSFLVGVLVASTVGLIVKTISDQNDERKKMIVELRETGAKLAALAEENANLQAQLLTQAREAGVLEERQRMAREIHDTIAQGLTGIVTQLEAVDTETGSPAVRSRLDQVRTLARDSLTEARRSVQALRPSPLQHEAQLATALEEVAAKWSLSTGVPASVSVTGDPRPLHVEVETALLRVAQEALANVAKHASAGRVGLTLSYMEDVVALDVRDDGRGFTPGPGEGGFGLIAMRQRIIRLAGDFAVESAPGQGTGISATVPAIPTDPSPDRSPDRISDRSPDRSPDPSPDRSPAPDSGP
ncbi:sensor histidine kinase [Nonomuraea sp. KM90]|uniref:sensor histidine kinase n=1 Tax=Nonomuraea sp. KM90 TaxID=3457428 RepID=UPI003FCC8ADD